jgi:hypothetical protein
MMNEDQNKLGAFPFVIAGISFIPLIGVLFGMVAVIWGLVTKKQGGKKLAIIGACGIVFTIVVYGALFYFGFSQRGGVYDELRVKLGESTITTLAQSIEFYKAQNGHYPISLEELQESLPEASIVFIVDPTHINMEEKQRNFYYELQGDNHYYLLGVGQDEVPFSRDDIIPKIEIKENSSIGLLIHDDSKGL